MTVRITFVVLLAATVSVAQKNNFKVDTLWLHRENPNEEEPDIESKFPIVVSNNPVVDRNINTVLQMETFGLVLTDKRKAELLSSQSDLPTMRQNYNFQVAMPTNRLLTVDIMPYFVHNSMSLNGHS